MGINFYTPGASHPHEDRAVTPPHDPDIDPQGDDTSAHLPRNHIDIGLRITSLMEQGVRLGVISPDRATQAGYPDLSPAPPPADVLEDSARTVEIERALRVALDQGAISGRKAAEIVRTGDLELARKAEERAARKEFVDAVAALGCATGMLDDEGAGDILATEPRSVQLAIGCQILTGIAELQHRWERFLCAAAKSDNLQAYDLDKLASMVDFIERKDILDLFSRRREVSDTLRQAVSLNALTSAEAATIGAMGDGPAQDTEIEKVCLKIEAAEMLQIKASSAERTIGRALELGILDPERATELRSIADVEIRFRDVKYLHILIEMCDEMERSLANQDAQAPDSKPTIDLLKFMKKIGGSDERI